MSMPLILIIIFAIIMAVLITYGTIYDLPNDFKQLRNWKLFNIKYNLKHSNVTSSLGDQRLTLFKVTLPFILIVALMFLANTVGIGFMSVDVNICIAFAISDVYYLLIYMIIPIMAHKTTLKDMFNVLSKVAFSFVLLAIIVTICLFFMGDL